MQQNENDPLQNENNQQNETILQQEKQEQNEQHEENDKKTQISQEQSIGNEKQNEQINNTSQFTNNQQQEVNKEKTTLDTDQQGETQEALNEKEQLEKQKQLKSLQETINQSEGSQQKSINDQTIQNSQGAQLSNINEVQQETKQNQSNKLNQQEQEQKQQEQKKEENDLENQSQRNNQKKKTTKRKTTKVEIKEIQDQNNPTQSNNDINQQKQENDQNNIENQEKVDLEQNQQKLDEQQQKEELLKKQEQEQQERIQNQLQREKFLKSLIFPLRTQNKKGKALSFKIENEKLNVEWKECKSAKRQQREKKPRTRSAINKELFDFYNKMNPSKPKDQRAMTPNTLQRIKKQQELDEMKRDCERFEEQQIKQQITQQKQKTQIKKRNSTQFKKKLEVVVRKRKKTKIRNGLRERMIIDKDKDCQLKALDFIRKMQQNRMAAEQKRQEQLEKLSLKISINLESLRKGSLRYKEEQQKQKRKYALEQITKQEQKRYDMILEQQKNEKFVRELKEKSVRSHYSAKKLAQGFPTSLVTELDNGQIKIEQNIDSNRKMNENQFLLKEELKKQIQEAKNKKQDYSKQVSLLHFPKVNLKKNYELVNQQFAAENKDVLPEIKPKRKKAWQIEQELQQKKYQNSQQFKE